MKETSHRQSLLSSMVIMGSTLSTRVLGFLRNALISAVFGGGGQTDVLFWAFSIPNNFRKLLAEGALSAAFIPEISRQLIQDDSGKEAKDLVRSILGLLLLLVIPICLIFIIFPHSLVNLLSDFVDPVQSAQAAKLLQLFINYLLLVAISALLMALLNSHSKFFIPAITPLLFSISVISSILLLHRTMGIYSMVLGVLVGGVMQILFQLPSSIRLGYWPLPRFHFKTESFQRVMHSWFPIMITSSIFVVNQQIAHYFASRLEEGSVTALSNALLFWQLPYGIFFNSIATVTYPKLSRQFSRDDKKGMGETLILGILALSSLLIPSAMILMTMGSQVISITLQRGLYQLSHTLMAGKVLFAYATGLLSVGLYNFTQRVFYSMGNMKQPFIAALITLVTDVLFTLFFIFKLEIGVQGLAYANTIAFTAGFLFLLISLKGKLSFGPITPLAVELVKITVSLIPATLWIWAFQRYLGDNWWTVGSNWKGLGLLAIQGLVALLLILASFTVFKLKILSILRNRGKDDEKV